jgi:hypothetical protein
VNKGYYEGDYYAGACQIELIGFAMNHVSELETRPDPKLLLLPEGSSTEVDFALKRIAGRIEGRVIDTEGLPMEKLRLYLYRHVPLQDPATGRERDARPCVSSANTDDDGWFSFEHLAPGRFVIGASEGNFQPLAKPGASRLGAMYPGKEVELGDSLFARTEISVVRSHPCRVHGSVVVDREWRRRQASPYSVPDVMLLTHEPRPDGKDTERDVRAWNGEFDFFLDVSAPEPRLRMRAGETSIFVPLALVPDGELPLVLRFPK